MRPVNLIPVGQRRGQHAPVRSGRFAPYIVIGFLVLALAGVSALVLTNNKISDSKSELADLEQEAASLKLQAQQVAPYTEFAAVRDQRMQTATSLADSRFDWERVLRELALVLPDNVWLLGITGTATPQVLPGEGAVTVAQRDTVVGPALELVGCAPGQDAVAGLVAALYDIDGVTRVGLSKSELPDAAVATPSTGTATASPTSGSEDCRTRDFIARFEIVVAFDEAPAAGTAAPAPVAPADDSTVTSADTGGVAEASQQEDAARQSTEAQTDKARAAITTFTP